VYTFKNLLFKSESKAWRRTIWTLEFNGTTSRVIYVIHSKGDMLYANKVQI